MGMLRGIGALRLRGRQRDLIAQWQCNEMRKTPAPKGRVVWPSNSAGGAINLSSVLQRWVEVRNKLEL